MRLSFKYKFILSFLTIEIFFISLIVFFNFSSLTNLSHSLIDEKIQTETRLLTEMVKAPIIVYDLGMLDNQIKSFANIKSIAAVKVSDNRQRVLSSITKDPKFDIDRLDKTSDEIIFNGRILKSAMLPIAIDGEIIGSVKVLFDLTNIHQGIDKNRRLTFLLILIEIVISIIIAFIIGHRLTNGLNRLTLSAQRIAQDDQTPIPDVGSNGDEMSILSNALHIMQQRIAERNKNLIDAFQELQGSTTQLQLLLDAMSEGVYGVNNEGICTFVNTSFLEILGYTNTLDVIGKDIHELIHHSHPDGSFYPSCECEMKKVVKNLVRVNVSNEVFWHKDGQAVAVEYWSNPIMIEGECVGAMATFVDITQRKKIENELLKLSQGMEQNPHSIVITDLHGNIEYVNTAFTVASGYASNEVIGKNPNIFKSGKTSNITYKKMWMSLSKGERWIGEFINSNKNGDERIQSVTISPIYRSDGQITHYMAIEEDVTERKHSEARIHYMANFDPLTGLPNRAQLDDRLAYILGLAKRNREQFAVMFLDLDHFKDINDTLGHSIGDALLIELAKRLQSSLREEDTVSRMGGDEFIGLFPDVNEHGAKQIAQKLLNVIAQPFMIGEHTLTVTGSIGIALYPLDGLDMENLSKNADLAMYRAKQDGRNDYCFFTEEMQMHSVRNLKLVNALRYALENGQLHLVYQPQISAKTGCIIGTEALLRWDHPTLGTISPAEFIPLAEESGLILSIGEWVLRTAVQQIKRWIQSGYAPIMMAVNISAVQFRHPSLPSLVTRILNEENLLPQYLELELTEGVAMNNPLAAIAIMDDLHARGIRMSIDDFGTGYSSLSYLKKFKVYKLKIDQSFVRDITTDPEDKAIVGAVISMAHSLGLQTIAEGVETIDQLDYLREQGCDEIQGYYYSKPLRPELMEEFVRNLGISKIN